MVPPGSVAVARMYRSCINLGDLHTPFNEGRSDLLTEGASRSMQESDSSIVVRDGRADRMAKGWAEWIIEHSTQAEALLAPLKCLPRTLFNPTHSIYAVSHCASIRRSPVREYRTQGSARGLPGDGQFYLNG